MHVLLVYFSATGNTSKIGRVIKSELEQLGARVDEYDITSYQDRQRQLDVGPYDAVVFGFPVHSHRAPRVAREWLTSLDGSGKKCSTFFTYGGFQIHPAHHTTRQILETQGFHLVSSAEFLGAHTFNLGGWTAMEGRPDDSDYKLAREYTVETYNRFTGEMPDTLQDFERTDQTEEHLDAIEAYRFYVVTQGPSRLGEECSMCMLCEDLCPTEAMDAERGETDRSKCIACLRCVATCPDEVLKINDLCQMWPIQLQIQNETEEGLVRKVSRLYL